VPDCCSYLCLTAVAICAITITHKQYINGKNTSFALLLSSKSQSHRRTDKSPMEKATIAHSHMPGISLWDTVT